MYLFIRKKILEKFISRGWDFDHPDIGYARGNCTSPDMKLRAKGYIKYLEDKAAGLSPSEPPGSHLQVRESSKLKGATQEEREK